MTLPDGITWTAAQANARYFVTYGNESGDDCQLSRRQLS
jgi:hypothetical protein